MSEDREEHAEVEEETPFDANPPVDPSQPQVGNSKARFFLPREARPEEEARDGEEEGDREEEHGESAGGAR